jgi:YD repeat-containing protein
MFANKPRMESAFRAILIAVILFNMLVPNLASASSPSIENSQSVSKVSTNIEAENSQNNYTPPQYAHPSPRIAERPEQYKNSLAQESGIFLQYTNYYGDSYCEDPNPGTVLTETIDTTTDIRFIRFNVLCDGAGCQRDVYYHATLSVEWGNGIPFEWFHETASLGAGAYFSPPPNITGNISSPCGSGSSGSCRLETYGMIPGELMNAGAPYQFAIHNTGGTGATGEWHHRVLTVTVSLSPLGIPSESVNCKGCSPYNSTQSFAADPVNTHTGTMSYPVKDMELSTGAGTLSFSHTYISSEINRFTSPLGVGWVHNQDIRLIFPSANEPPYVLFKDHSGNLYRFQDMGDGSYAPYAGITSTLVKNSGNPVTYTLKDQSQNVYLFDLDGKLLSLTDANGRAFTYTYGSNGQLSRVSADNETRYLDFSYDQQDRLESVTNIFR